MQVIWKYRLFNVFHGGLQELPMSADATVLTAAVQFDTQVVLWALDNQSEPLVNRVFVMYATGRPIVEGQKLAYVATVKVLGSASDLVYHVFEVLS